MFVGEGVSVAVGSTVAVGVADTVEVADEVGLGVSVTVKVAVDVGISVSSVATGVSVSIGASVSVTSGRRKLQALAIKATRSKARPPRTRNCDSCILCLCLLRTRKHYSRHMRAFSHALSWIDHDGSRMNFSAGISGDLLRSGEGSPLLHLALQQAVQLRSDVSVVQNAKPAGDNHAIGINQEILSLRGRTQLGSLGVMIAVVHIKDDEGDLPGVRFLQSTHGGLITSAGRSPRGPRLIKGKTRYAWLGNDLGRRRFSRARIAS